MKILVVHDREEVARAIVELLEAEGIEPGAIKVAIDGVGARNCFQSELFDLAIVDLTIPHINGKSEVDYSVAEGLLVELFETDGLNTPGDIIGITKDEKALESIDSGIGPHLMAVIEEDAAGAWKKRLSDRLSYVVKAARSRQRSINQHFDVDVAIITALDEECVPYSQIFELRPEGHFPNLKSFIFEDGHGIIRRGIVYSVGEPGQAPTASMAQSIISQYRPSLCLMSGICGGFKDETKIGNVIVAESVFNWDCGKWKGDGDTATFSPRPDPITIKGTGAHDAARALAVREFVDKDEIVGRVAALSGGKLVALDVKLSRIASGSAVVANKAIINRIQGLNDKILAVDMEAYGLYYAARYTPVKKPNFLVVKAVSDFCDAEKSDDFHAACSYLAAKVVHELVCRLWDFDTHRPIGA